MRGRLWMTATLTLAGCSGAPELPPGTYPLPVDQVFAKLYADPLVDAMKMARCGVPIQIANDGAANETVTWRVVSAGSTRLTLTATLIPVDATTTRVTLAADDGVNGDKSYAGNQFYPRPVVQQPILPILREEVDAVLGNRPFDMDRLRGDDQPQRPEGAFSHGSTNDENRVCLLQRGASESGHKFSVDDALGDSQQSGTPVPSVEMGKPASNAGQPMLRP